MNISYMAVPGVPHAEGLLAGILNIVCLEEGVSIDEIRSRSRMWKVSRARHLFCWMARQKGYGHKEIGSAVCRDRATVVHSEKTINELKSVDKKIGQSVMEICKKIG
jgi:chromosomal replication initiation ATPase DnaA